MTVWHIIGLKQIKKQTFPLSQAWNHFKKLYFIEFVKCILCFISFQKISNKYPTNNMSAMCQYTSIICYISICLTSYCTTFRNQSHIPFTSLFPCFFSHEHITLWRKCYYKCLPFYNIPTFLTYWCMLPTPLIITYIDHKKQTESMVAPIPVICAQQLYQLQKLDLPVMAFHHETVAQE